MRRISWFLLVLIVFAWFPVWVLAEEDSPVLTPPQTVSVSYEVMDAHTGQVYISKLPESRRYPASITKILTVALFLEKTKGSMEGTLTVSQAAIDQLEEGASNVALQPGEVITVRDAIMATALMSANDATNCLAEYVAGSLTDFAAVMNAKAEELGCSNSHFVTSNGLHDPQHYTTAHDMALITRYALEVPGVVEAFSTVSYTMEPTNLQPEYREFGTGHSMLAPSEYIYEGAVMGKTGWTPEANHTMVTVAKRDGRELICVVLDSSPKWEKYKDTIALLEYCFTQFRQVTYPEDALETMEFQVYDEEHFLGKVTAVPPVCSFALHNSLETEDIQIQYEQVPRRMKPGDPTVPVIRFSLAEETNCMENDLPAFSMQMYGMENCVQAVKKEIMIQQDQTEPPFHMPSWFWPVFFMAVLILILYGIRRYNLYKRKLRHIARMMARQRAMDAAMVRKATQPPIIYYTNPDRTKYQNTIRECTENKRSQRRAEQPHTQNRQRHR